MNTLNLRVRSVFFIVATQLAGGFLGSEVAAGPIPIPLPVGDPFAYARAATVAASGASSGTPDEWESYVFAQSFTSQGEGLLLNDDLSLDGNTALTRNVRTLETKFEVAYACTGDAQEGDFFAGGGCFRPALESQVFQAGSAEAYADLREGKIGIQALTPNQINIGTGDLGIQAQAFARMDDYLSIYIPPELRNRDVDAVFTVQLDGTTFAHESPLGVFHFFAGAPGVFASSPIDISHGLVGDVDTAFVQALRVWNAGMSGDFASVSLSMEMFMNGPQGEYLVGGQSLSYFNTATLSLTLSEPGLAFTSASGVFLQSSGVPEPSTAVLALIGALGLGLGGMFKGAQRASLGGGRLLQDERRIG